LNNSPQKLYLDLMKKVLTFTLWSEPPMPIDSPVFKRSRFNQKYFFSVIAKIFSLMNLQLVKTRDVSEIQRTEGEIWPGYADTMIGMKRLDNLQECVESVISENIEGDLIETGVWRGGACIFMRAILKAYNVEDRKVFVADSFEGLPKPDIEKHPADEGDRHYTYNYIAVSQDQVKHNFRKYDLLDEQVVFLEGWFKDTLPNAPIEKISILRLDGDMYGSTIDAIEALYPKLSVGGYCIIDDYALHGCKIAVDEYRKKHSINSELKKIDNTASYWRKTEEI